MVAEPLSQTEARQIAATSLRTFMRLPVRERSSIILMDVLGYSLSELSTVAGPGCVTWRRNRTSSRYQFFPSRRRIASPFMLIGSTPETSRR
ncbi:hypothetical protein CO652_22165 [Rhizobium sp. H4]|uniref:hypothetical protein n=1 Tax=Rhizobium TaxID=379 RepID=UPI000BE95A13|nr:MULTISPECIES: hypothetical protein [Rhizobium]PDV86161.1 hypothetical protein CO652_22165 [Rhizobium sp. H4]WET74627.1 hypothetical protein PYR68_03655 [Rhizobium croatiense]